MGFRGRISYIVRPEKNSPAGLAEAEFERPLMFIEPSTEECGGAVDIEPVVEYGHFLRLAGWVFNECRWFR